MPPPVVAAQRLRFFDGFCLARNPMSYWLFKSEPDTYSIADLARAGWDWWDGVRNYQARNFMWREMKVGDGVLFYHSSCAVPAVVGEARVSREAIPDETQFNSDSPYYDSQATLEKPRWWCVAIEYRQTFPHPVPLKKLRETPALADLRILQRGNRLSITPVEKNEWQLIRRLGAATA